MIGQITDGSEKDRMVRNEIVHKQNSDSAIFSLFQHTFRIFRLMMQWEVT